MCGIAACIKKHGVIDRTKFESMTDIVSHRGPDDRGTYYDDELALGHRRLAIIDLSADGHQPFTLVDGYVLIFNGEIYNYIELRQELSEKGHQFQTQTDTEIIIIAYKEWGKDCVKHFNGMWSFVLYDKYNNLLFCSRDRFGIKPFYYTEQEGMFLIASEIKQFFEMLEGQPRADKQRLIEYIIRGTIDHVPYTLFQDIYQLRPGNNLIYDLGDKTYQIGQYFDLKKKGDISKSYAESCDTFRERFIDSVLLRLRSDVPVGYFLSGGLDSSSIVCTADKLIKENTSNEDYHEQHTISSCYEDKQYDEQEYIDEVVSHTSVIPHKVYPEENDLWKDLDKIIWHMDEPLSGMSAFSQWEVCAEAKKQGLTVMLDGQGSDEQLAGYTDFYTVYFLYLLKKGKLKLLKQEINAYKSLRATTEKDVSSFRIILSAFKDMVTPKSMDRFFKYLFMTRVAKLPFEKKIIKESLRDEVIYPRRDASAYIKAYMDNELMSILHHLDRKSMAFSIEIRDPFLDYRLVESVFEMPFEHKIRQGYTKAVLRDGLKGILPEKIRKRISKLAFVAPQDKWMRDHKELYHKELQAALHEYRTLFDTGKVLRWFESKKAITRQESLIIWRIIDSARWIKVFHVAL